MLGRGWLVADHGRHTDAAGSLQTLEGIVVATARARFFAVE